MGSKPDSLLVENSCDGNIASYSEQNEAVLSLLIAAWGFNNF